MNYNDIDFAKLFTKQKKLSSIKVKSPKGWDLKASYMNKRVAKSVYNEMFLQRMDLISCKSLLDFGCGTGNISLKIAHKLHKIYAIDSSPKMIQTYEKNAKNINNVETYIQDINDTWDMPKCDIVIASRSINSILDVKEVLIKLDSYAKKRVYLTYKTNFSFYDKKLYDFLGKEVMASPDYIHILNILYSLGIYAKLDFIQAESRYQHDTTYEKFLNAVEWEIGELTQNEKERLKIYFEKNVLNKPDIYNIWAFISWEKEGK